MMRGTARDKGQLRVALVQMAVKDGDADANLDAALRYLADCKGADVVLLPELWTTGYAHDRWSASADRATPRAGKRVSEAARDLGAWVAGSMITRRDDGGLSNRLVLYAPDGSTRVHYDKGHLFPPLKEDVLLVAGAERAAADIHGWPAAFSICYDLRFPEMYRRDALDGAKLFLVCSAWPAARYEVMRTLAAARAIENQAFLALCNRVGGSDDGTVFGGGSAIFAPDGSVVADAGPASPGIAFGTIHEDAVISARAGLPCFAARARGLDW